MSEIILSPKMQEISERIGNFLLEAREGSIDNKYSVATELFTARDAEGLFEDDWGNMLAIHGMTQRSADRFMGVYDKIKQEELTDLIAVRADISGNKGLDWSHIEVLSRLARKGDRGKAVKWWQKQDAENLSVQKLNKFVNDLIKSEEPTALRDLTVKGAAQKLTKQSQSIDNVFQEVERLGLDFGSLDLTEKSKEVKLIMLDSVRNVVERGTELLKSLNAMTPRTKKSEGVVASAKAAKAQAEKNKAEAPAPEASLSRKRVKAGVAAESEPEYDAADDVEETTPSGDLPGAVKANRPGKAATVSNATGGAGTGSGRRRALTDASLK